MARDDGRLLLDELELIEDEFRLARNLFSIILEEGTFHAARGL